MKKKSKKLNKNKENRKKLIIWRDNVRQVWNYKCAYCGSKDYLNAHHIISKSVKELKYDTKNGILLCSKCHIFNSISSAHKGSLVFITWLILNHPTIITYLLNQLNNLNYLKIGHLNNFTKFLNGQVNTLNTLK